MSQSLKAKARQRYKRSLKRYAAGKRSQAPRPNPDEPKK